MPEDQEAFVAEPAKRFELPGPSDRTIIVGQTGSGKTTFGVWLLSHMNYDRMPWVIVDYKREMLFRELGKQAFRSILTPTSPPPVAPGLHILQPFESDEEEMDNFFWRVWRSGMRGRGVGMYFDETSLLPAGKGSAIRAILTQGRSMKLPIIALSQRPVDIDRMFFSESQYFAEFFLLDREDRKTVMRYAPIDPDDEPERFHCWWYDSKERHVSYLAPVPDKETFLGRLRTRAPRRFWINL